jgi:GTP-binding protein
MKSRSIVIAIDGPSGSGKSSTARGLAARCGFDYLDTGALYRAATVVALEKNLVDPKEIVNVLLESNIDFLVDPKNPITKILGKDVSIEIRSKRVTDEVSRISAEIYFNFKNRNCGRRSRHRYGCRATGGFESFFTS